ncbi:MAG TPA: hypothetical protein VGL56_00965 [Fimbriimonadaceae bacterium]|jgi:prepilin-type processing-associated H-X9-DG protein
MIEEGQALAPRRKQSWVSYALVVLALGVSAAALWPPYEIKAAPRSVRLSNAKQLAMAIFSFENDHNDTLPDMTNTNVLRSKLMPYIQHSAVFKDPDSKRPFIPNFVLSKVKASDIRKPEEVILIYSPIIEKNGTRGVAFADGHARDISEDDFVKDVALTGAHLATSGPRSQ